METLLKRTEENKELRKLQLETKYCLRQSKLGVGDCADIDQESIRKIQKARAEKVVAQGRATRAEQEGEGDVNKVEEEEEEEEEEE